MQIPDFIEVYDDMLDAATCAALVARFNASGQSRRGATGSGVDVALKNSWDIVLDTQPDWADVRHQLNNAVLAGVQRYLRQYPYAAIAPLQLKLPDAGAAAAAHASAGAVPAAAAAAAAAATGAAQARALDAKRFAALNDNTLAMVLGHVFRPGGINLQRYIADEGGYPYWHSEQYPKLDNGEALHRVLLWTLYLNDGFDAGETEFLYQQRSIKPKTGSLLLAPAAFTHTHRGNRPLGGDKYIATSWVLFQRAEALYGGRR